MASMFVHIAVSEKMLRSFLTFLLLAAMTTILGGVVEDGLKQTSLHERVCMRAFFNDAIKMDQIAHVLYFENKPISIIAKTLRCNNVKYFNDSLCLKGWMAFKKYEHLFPHPHFLFSESIVSFDESFKVLHVYLINKDATYTCLEKNLYHFRKTLGEEFNPREFILQLEKGVPLDILLNKDEMLLGILLGFGEESSKAFVDFNTKQIEPFESPKEERYCAINLKKPRGCKINPVVFMGNPNSPQVLDLASDYEKELEEISRIYGEKKDPLKMVLEKLCEK